MRSLTSILDGVFLELPLYLRILIILIFLAAAAIFSYRKRFLTLSGVSTAIVLGFIVFFIGGISGIAIFLFFFISASMLSRLSDEPSLQQSQKLKLIQQLHRSGCCQPDPLSQL